MTYSERLHTPWWWWLVGLFFGGSIAVAVLAYVPLEIGIAACALALLAVVALLVAYGRTKLVVDEDGLLAGRHRVEPEYLGPATAYEGDAAREALGPGADPRAFLFTRPVLSSVVRVDLRDPADPHPYWLVSTRHPERLADALRQEVTA